VCALCQAPGPLPWLTSEFCERCCTDLIAGFHRRYEASLRLAPIGDAPRDPLAELWAA
jgi:hypothetical protein